MQILRDRSHLAELCPPLDCRPRKHSLGLCVKNLTNSSLITKSLQVFPRFLYHARSPGSRPRKYLSEKSTSARHYCSCRSRVEEVALQGMSRCDRRAIQLYVNDNCSSSIMKLSDATMVARALAGGESKGGSERTAGSGLRAGVCRAPKKREGGDVGRGEQWPFLSRVDL